MKNIEKVDIGIEDNKRVFERLMNEYPLAHALPRAIECCLLRKFELKFPVLDLGCGDGMFSRICLGDRKIDVGLDPCKQVVRAAHKSGAYKKVVVAKADRMPFEDHFFNTVISNSVLEHIEDLDAVFREVYRVLKKRGRFIFLVPDKTASDYFFYSWVLEKVKLGRLAKAYVEVKNRLYSYVHLEEKKYWQEVVGRNSFKIRSVTGFIPPGVVRIIDLFSPLSLPYFLLRKVFGQGFVWRVGFEAKLFINHLIPRLNSAYGVKPTAWCFELKKK